MHLRVIQEALLERRRGCEGASYLSRELVMFAAPSGYGISPDNRAPCARLVGAKFCRSAPSPWCAFPWRRTRPCCELSPQPQVWRKFSRDRNPAISPARGRLLRPMGLDVAGRAATAPVLLPHQLSPARACRVPAVHPSPRQTKRDTCPRAAGAGSAPPRRRRNRMPMTPGSRVSHSMTGRDRGRHPRAARRPAMGAAGRRDRRRRPH
jgi:hypothetical protein